MAEERIQKIMAEQGLCSRRAAEQIIAEGRAQTRSAAVQSKAAARRPRGPVGKGTAPKSGSKPIYLYKRKESTCTAGAFFIVKCYFL